MSAACGPRLDVHNFHRPKISHEQDRDEMNKRVADASSACPYKSQDHLRPDEKLASLKGIYHTNIQPSSSESTFVLSLQNPLCDVGPAQEKFPAETEPVLVAKTKDTSSEIKGRTVLCAQTDADHSQLSNDISSGVSVNCPPEAAPFNPDLFRPQEPEVCNCPYNVTVDSNTVVILAPRPEEIARQVDPALPRARITCRENIVAPTLELIRQAVSHMPPRSRTLGLRESAKVLIFGGSQCFPREVLGVAIAEHNSGVWDGFNNCLFLSLKEHLVPSPRILRGLLADFFCSLDHDRKRQLGLGILPDNSPVMNIEDVCDDVLTAHCVSHIANYGYLYAPLLVDFLINMGQQNRLDDILKTPVDIAFFQSHSVSGAQFSISFRYPGSGPRGLAMILCNQQGTHFERLRPPRQNSEIMTSEHSCQSPSKPHPRQKLRDSILAPLRRNHVAPALSSFASRNPFEALGTICEDPSEICPMQASVFTVDTCHTPAARTRPPRQKRQPEGVLSFGSRIIRALTRESPVSEQPRLAHRTPRPVTLQDFIPVAWGRPASHPASGAESTLEPLQRTGSWPPLSCAAATRGSYVRSELTRITASSPSPETNSFVHPLADQAPLSCDVVSARAANMESQRSLVMSCLGPQSLSTPASTTPSSEGACLSRSISRRWNPAPRRNSHVHDSSRAGQISRGAVRSRHHTISKAGKATSEHKIRSSWSAAECCVAPGATQVTVLEEDGAREDSEHSEKAMARDSTSNAENAKRRRQVKQGKRWHWPSQEDSRSGDRNRSKEIRQGKRWSRTVTSLALGERLAAAPEASRPRTQGAEAVRGTTEHNRAQNTAAVPSREVFADFYQGHQDTIPAATEIGLPGCLSDRLVWAPHSAFISDDSVSFPCSSAPGVLLDRNHLELGPITIPVRLNGRFYSVSLSTLEPFDLDAVSQKVLSAAAPNCRSQPHVLFFGCPRGAARTEVQQIRRLRDSETPRSWEGIDWLKHCGGYIEIHLPLRGGSGASQLALVPYQPPIYGADRDWPAVDDALAKLALGQQLPNGSTSALQDSWALAAYLGGIMGLGHFDALHRHIATWHVDRSSLMSPARIIALCDLFRRHPMERSLRPDWDESDKWIDVRVNNLRFSDLSLMGYQFGSRQNHLLTDAFLDLMQNRVPELYALRRDEAQRSIWKRFKSSVRIRGNAEQSQFLSIVVLLPPGGQWRADLLDGTIRLTDISYITPHVSDHFVEVNLRPCDSNLLRTLAATLHCQHHAFLNVLARAFARAWNIPYVHCRYSCEVTTSGRGRSVFVDPQSTSSGIMIGLALGFLLDLNRKDCITPLFLGLHDQYPVLVQVECPRVPPAALWNLINADYLGPALRPLSFDPSADPGLTTGELVVGPLPRLWSSRRLSSERVSQLEFFDAIEGRLSSDVVRAELIRGNSDVPFAVFFSCVDMQAAGAFLTLLRSEQGQAWFEAIVGLRPPALFESRVCPECIALLGANRLGKPIPQGQPRSDGQAPPPDSGGPSANARV